MKFIISEISNITDKLSDNENKNILFYENFSKFGKNKYVIDYKNIQNKWQKINFF